MSNGKEIRQEKSLLYSLYSLLGTIVHVLLVPLVPLLGRLAGGGHLEHRLGRYRPVAWDKGEPLIWIHAASVGEVQAARALIVTLQSEQSNWHFFLTTMTVQGRAFALSTLPESVRCELAPLDLPPAVKRALRTVQPDMYICLETELWPVLLTEVRRTGIPLLLLNGRMSERSCRRYTFIQITMARLLSCFAAVGVISEQDGACYRRLGVNPAKIIVCGNIKYDLPQGDIWAVKKKFQEILQPGARKVFICGSTRTGEEELLVPVYRRLQAEVKSGVLWVIAPRHLDRLTEVRRLLEQEGLAYTLFSRCRSGEKNSDIVLVDTMGDLSGLYGAGDFVFCGGSLVDKGGHNIMEPVLRHRPVFFGPYMQDFKDAVSCVLSAGAGFQVADARELAEALAVHVHRPGLFKRAEKAAADLADSQHGAVQCQAKIVLQQWQERENTIWLEDLSQN